MSVSWQLYPPLWQDRSCMAVKLEQAVGQFVLENLLPLKSGLGV